MANPTAEGNRFFDPKRFHQLLKVAPLRAVANNCEVGQVISQQLSSCAQPEITGFAGDQAPNENKIEFGTRFQGSRVAETQGLSDARLWHKEHLVSIRGKL